MSERRKGFVLGLLIGISLLLLFGVSVISFGEQSDSRIGKYQVAAYGRDSDANVFMILDTTTGSFKTVKVYNPDYTYYGKRSSVGSRK